MSQGIVFTEVWFFLPAEGNDISDIVDNRQVRLSAFWWKLDDGIENFLLTMV